MPKIVQINPVVRNGSTGRITEQIGNLVLEKGWESFIAYSGRPKNISNSGLIQIGDYFDSVFHALETRLLDRHGLGSKKATFHFLNKLDNIKPDLIHLHNIHGYYVNYELLFRYISNRQIPVVWTFHDFWPITGHCTYFSDVKCEKWKTQCFKCPKIKYYPKSWFLDNSRENYIRKKLAFSQVADLTLVPVSRWAGSLLEKSFLGKNEIKVIYNGVDINQFEPKKEIDFLKTRLGLNGKFILMGLATTWGKRKGWSDYFKLAERLSSDCQIVLVGVTESQKRDLPVKITGIERTESVEQLAQLYSMADIVMNLSYQETFGLTTVEGFACGSPGIVYNSTASPELMSPEVGEIVEPGNINEVIGAIEKIKIKGKEHYSKNCRTHAIKFFSAQDRFNDYIDLYEQKLKTS